MTHHWHKLTIQSEAGLLDAISASIFDLGAIGTEEKRNVVIVYFPEEIDIGRVKESLMYQIRQAKEELGISFDASISTGKIAQEDWGENWKQHFGPIEIDPRLIIAPSWKRIKKSKGQVKVTIDPQQAFGTGGHETTFLALKAVVSLVRPGMSVLDAGTGSGILAIASSKLGACRVVAFDVDPVAIEIAGENARKNHMEGRVRLLVADGAHFKTRFDLVLANMISSRLLGILPGLVSCIGKKGGRLVLSGILGEEQERFEEALVIHGLIVIDVSLRGEWISFICRLGAE